MNLGHSRRRFLKRSALTLAGALIAADTRTGVAAQRSYVLATATLGGTFYPVGVALGTLIKVKLRPVHGIDMSAISSAGSTDNVRLLNADKAQFALISALIGHYAWTGQGPFIADGTQTSLRAVTALWREPEHFVVKKEYAETGTISDMLNLKGKKVSLGLQGSGTIASNQVLLGNLGIDVDQDMELVYLGYEASAEALQAGQIEAMSVPGGVPVAAVTQAMSALGEALVILEFTEAQLAKVNGSLDLWSRYAIKAGTYPTQDKDIHTIAAPAFLAVRADVDEEAVYEITKTIYENLTFLKAIHKALLNTTLEHALTGLPIPLHPGALQYYRETGLEAPAKLTPPVPS